MNRVFAALLTLVLACLLLAPTAAFAEERSVTIENHTTAQDQATTVSDVRIGGVDAPAPDKQLDDKAQVTTAEGKTWDVPVIWVRDDLTIIMPNAAEATGGHAYLPVLAFFVPSDYALASGDFTVTLSNDLTALFGTDETISVYSQETGVTYILPASLKSLFVRPATAANAAAPDATSEAAADEAAEEEQLTLVDIYCAQTARRVLSDEDLEWLIDLVINKLEPQAVNLLLDRFPAFRTAADNGQIGTKIGFYVYYVKGDQDGDEAHTDTPHDALAYVAGDSSMVNGEARYCYMIGLDVDDLIMKDDDKEPVTNPETGKFSLVRTGEPIETLANTMVHELFHAFSDDYNRLGMCGTISMDNRETGESGGFINERTGNEYIATRFPSWFVEGSASAVENNYQFRKDQFNNFMRDSGGDVLNEDILLNYLDNSPDKKKCYFDLRYSTDTDDSDDSAEPTNANYLTGYLAVLFLSDLAYGYGHNGESAVTADGTRWVTSTEKLCEGLNQIIEWLHDDDSTLDAVIANISPVDDQGEKLYSNTQGFVDMFIKGKDLMPPESEMSQFAGDKPSLSFVSKYLSSLVELEKSKGFRPNGSLLFDYDADFTSPLDPEKDATADYFVIVESNTLVESTVSSDTGAIGGGKSCSSNKPYQGEEAAAGNGASAGAGAQLSAASTDEPLDDTTSTAPSGAAPGETGVAGSTGATGATGTTGDTASEPAGAGEGAPDSSAELPQAA